MTSQFRNGIGLGLRLALNTDNTQSIGNTAGILDKMGIIERRKCISADAILKSLRPKSK